LNLLSRLSSNLSEVKDEEKLNFYKEQRLKLLKLVYESKLGQSTKWSIKEIVLDYCPIVWFILLPQPILGPLMNCNYNYLKVKERTIVLAPI
jgi:hypothetical protein